MCVNLCVLQQKCDAAYTNDKSIFHSLINNTSRRRLLHDLVFKNISEIKKNHWKNIYKTHINISFSFAYSLNSFFSSTSFLNLLFFIVVKHTKNTNDNELRSLKNSSEFLSAKNNRLCAPGNNRIKLNSWNLQQKNNKYIKGRQGTNTEWGRENKEEIFRDCQNDEEKKL